MYLKLNTMKTKKQNKKVVKTTITITKREGRRSTYTKIFTYEDQMVLQQEAERIMIQVDMMFL
jgi:hypothetical protein